jgi:two-component system LytT family sensor kinase
MSWQMNEPVATQYAKPLDPTADEQLANNVLSAGLGVALSALLLLFILRSSRRARGVRLIFPSCALLWNLFALIKMCGPFIGIPQSSLASGLAEVFSSIVIAVWPFSILMWRNDSLSPLRKRLGNLLIGIATAMAVYLATAAFLSVWHTYIGGAAEPNLLFREDLEAYSGLFIMMAGAFVFLPGFLRDRSSRVSILIMFSGLVMTCGGIILHNYVHLPAALDRLVILFKTKGLNISILGVLFYSARFRASDIFVRLSLRVLVGAAIAVVAAHLFNHEYAFTTQASVGPHTLSVLSLSALVIFSILAFEKISVLTDALIERWVFGKIDYRQALRDFQKSVGLLFEEPEIVRATEQFLTQSLRLENVRIVPQSATPSRPALSDDPGERRSNDHQDKELSVPILQGDRITHLILITTDVKERILVSTEVEFVREATRYVESRLQEIGREKERLERASREARLIHQVVEAELRALRAQVNPHFLFNSLNTIAALVVPEPAKAEEMTLRLAKIFRHVLIHADQPFSSIEEEISFLRTYLEIEKVRFGERLKIEFDVNESVTQLSVPTLILQPLVENALKHGLAAKLGQSELTIRANRKENLLLLSVEDNGLGIKSKSKPGQSVGVGLRNVKERLQTVYGNLATFSFESRPQLGSRALVEIPIAPS